MLKWNSCVGLIIAYHVLTVLTEYDFRLLLQCSSYCLFGLMHELSFSCRLEMEQLKKGFSAVEKFIHSTTEVLSLTFGVSGR